MQNKNNQNIFFSNNEAIFYTVSLDQINDIPMINPNIENYVSEKMRYRDLKNKD